MRLCLQLARRKMDLHKFENTVWHEIFAGVYFCGLVIFCGLRELFFAISKNWFF